MMISDTFQKLHKDGFSFNDQSIDNSIIQKIESNLNAYFENNSQADKYAIRQLIKRLPDLNILFEIPILKYLIKEQYSLTKSIYFNKPAMSNWFVPYHQDLSIGVKEKIDTEGYKGWTFKKEQHGVIPPKRILENTITVRIHLDDTNEENGALRVIKNSHSNGILKREQINRINTDDELICKLNKSEYMLMKPLLLHASHKSTSNSDRRVIHLEFCNQELDGELEWLEY
ncbi:phytanoyl-CoA dioxygenase family protein [Nonlabens sp. Asnod3-A02]|uniref:phytanoyl-CoA dioxygenase family protein n=1 Tax=Nonlabens sp. Asnod3-A02 TaxID=3160579 RepID=UPI003865B4B2